MSAAPMGALWGRPVWMMAQVMVKQMTACSPMTKSIRVTWFATAPREPTELLDPKALREQGRAGEQEERVHRVTRGRGLGPRGDTGPKGGGWRMMALMVCRAPRVKLDPRVRMVLRSCGHRWSRRCLGSPGRSRSRRRAWS